MVETLKDRFFNEAFFDRLAGELAVVHTGYQRKRFLREVLFGLEERALNARMRHASITLRKYLPQQYREAVEVLKALASRMPKGYTALVYPDFVGQFGLDDPDFSLKALKYFTVFGSSEFAVREFLRRDIKGTLKTMRIWAGDENEHVRRLATEGCRPRLPWSFRLDAVVRDPALTTPILHMLRNDPSLYVRTSVANHLNDFSKDHPGHLLDLLRSWDLREPHIAWIAKRACRTLIKAGNADALALFNIDVHVQVLLSDLNLSATRIRIGDKLSFSFSLRSTSAKPQSLVVDYAIHYRKADGRSTRKVFKLKELELPGRGSIDISKRQHFMDLSTRKHYAGEHAVEVLVNGNAMGKVGFELKE